MRSQPKGGTHPAGHRMQQVLSSLDVLAHGHRLSGHTAFSTAPPGAKLSYVQFGWHVDLCHSPLTSASAHEVGDPHTYLKASYVEAVHELHRHLLPFACEMLRAQVRRVCSPGDLLHRQLVVADRLLEPQVPEKQCALLCPKPVLLVMDSAALDRNDSTQVFGKRLNPHRLCCCTVACVQFCFLRCRRLKKQAAPLPKWKTGHHFREFSTIQQVRIGET